MVITCASPGYVHFFGPWTHLKLNESTTKDGPPRKPPTMGQFTCKNNRNRLYAVSSLWEFIPSDPAAAFIITVLYHTSMIVAHTFRFYLPLFTQNKVSKQEAAVFKPSNNRLRPQTSEEVPKKLLMRQTLWCLTPRIIWPSTNHCVIQDCDESHVKAPKYYTSRRALSY